jgi:hypothetical protein
MAKSMFSKTNTLVIVLLLLILFVAYRAKQESFVAWRGPYRGGVVTANRVAVRGPAGNVVVANRPWYHSWIYW